MLLLPKKSKAGFTNRDAVGADFVSPAPMGGLNTKDPLAIMPVRYATVLENWFPGQDALELRKGSIQWVTGVPGTVKHLSNWAGPSSEKIFAFSSSGVFDVTTAGSVGPAVSAITNGDVSSVMFTTTGGSFLWCVNGTDSARYFNGTTWTATASYTVTSGGSITSDKFSVVHSFKRRLFAIEKDSMNFYFFDIDAIAGSVSRFPLGALFSEGGSLVSMGSWTASGGLTIDDYLVFVSSGGQAVVYQGTDPSDASAWKLQGVYKIGKPLGKNCMYKLGADLWVLTEFGMTSMSKVLSASISGEFTTLTAPIAPTFRELAATGKDLAGWQVVSSTKDNLLMVNVPRATLPTIQLACNLSTQAWSVFTGWPASAWVEGQTDLFFCAGGTVYKGWTSSNDAGVSITAQAKTAWTYLSPRGKKKQIRLVRPTMVIEGAAVVDIAVDTDFNNPLTYSSAFSSSGGLFPFNNPASLWNSARWGRLPQTRLDWLSVPCTDGHCFSFRLRVISGGASVSWFTTDCVYEVGNTLG